MRIFLLCKIAERKVRCFRLIKRKRKERQTRMSIKSYENKVEDVYNDKKVMTLIDLDFQNSKSVKSW